MSPLLQKVLEIINLRANVSPGLKHPNNKNSAREIFLRLYLAGETLLAEEIEAWALDHGWQANDAEALGDMAEQIGMGQEPLITGGPWWQDNIIEALSPHPNSSVLNLTTM